MALIFLSILLWPPEPLLQYPCVRAQKNAPFIFFIFKGPFARTLLSRLEVPWTWEKQSRGQKPKSRQKVSKKSPGAGGSQKSEKGLEKGPKVSKNKLFQTFWRLFGRFFEAFFADFWDAGTGRPRETFSRLFGDLAPRLLLPGPRNLKSRILLP